MDITILNHDVMCHIFSFDLEKLIEYAFTNKWFKKQAQHYFDFLPKHLRMDLRMTWFGNFQDIHLNWLCRQGYTMAIKRYLSTVKYHSTTLKNLKTVEYQKEYLKFQDLEQGYLNAFSQGNLSVVKLLYSLTGEITINFQLVTKFENIFEWICEIVKSRVNSFYVIKSKVLYMQIDLGATFFKLCRFCPLEKLYMIDELYEKIKHDNDKSKYFKMIAIQISFYRYFPDVAEHLRKKFNFNNLFDDGLTEMSKSYIYKILNEPDNGHHHTWKTWVHTHFTPSELQKIQHRGSDL